MWTCLCDAEATGQCQVSFFNHSPLHIFFLRQGHLLNLKVTDLSRLTGQLASGTHVSHPNPPQKCQCWNQRHLLPCLAFYFLHGFWTSKFTFYCFHDRHFANFTTAPKLSISSYIYLFYMYAGLCVCVSVHTYHSAHLEIRGPSAPQVLSSGH